VGLRVLLPQRDADQDGPPRRVRAAKGQRGLAGLGAKGVRQRGGGVIVGADGVGPPRAEPPTQVADRTHGQVERRREARRRVTPHGALVELLPYGDGDRFWHRKALRAVRLL
jgi:hypothetical protein